LFVDFEVLNFLGCLLFFYTGDSYGYLCQQKILRRYPPWFLGKKMKKVFDFGFGNTHHGYQKRKGSLILVLKIPTMVIKNEKGL